MANAYIDIYHPDGWIMMQPLITKEAERVEELMQADYAQLSWADTERIVIPAGAFIYDPDTGEPLTLLDPYEPEQKDELEYDYKPIFQSRVMVWGKVPFFHYTYDADGNITAREPDWVLTDNPANFMQAICDAIVNETGEVWSLEVAGDVIGNSATISFSATDVFSALNQIASEFDTEWLADKDNNTILLGKAMYDMGYYWQLIVGDNVGAPSVTVSKEGYYNRFYCFGSTRNITQDYKGASVNNLVNRRLTLSSADYPDGYIDTYREPSVPVFPKILIFDDIYPRCGFTVSDLRPRLMYRLNPDDNNSKIQIGTDADGNPVYDMYTIWYFQIDGFKLNDTTYSKDNPDGMLISGKNLSVHFSSGALTGREFELIYHPSAKRLSNSDGQDFNVKAGDYEIKFIEESGFILPAQVGIVPADGDEIILFNLRMPEEYIASSQQELAEAAYAEIDSKYTTDLNNYTLSSNPVAFDANGTFLPIGQMVEYYNGDYNYTTRVIKVTRKLDFACEQEIVIGNSKIKGNTATLKEEVVNANSNIDVLTQLNQLNQQVTQAYQRTTQMILDSMGKAAQYWTEHPTLPNTIITKYNVLGEHEIVANAKGSGSSGGIVSGNATSIGGYEVVLNTLRDGDVLVWNGSKWVNRAAASGGLDESSLAAYLQRNQYVTASDLGNYVTLDTEQHISGMKWFDAVETIFNTKARVDGSANSFAELPEFMFHIAGISWVKFKMDSGGGLHLLNGGSTDFYNWGDFYCRRICVGGSASQFLKADGSVDGTQYLPITGGTLLNGSEVAPLNINTTSPVEVGLRFFMNGNSKGWVGYNPANGANLYNYICNKAFGVRDDGTLHFDNNTVWHAGNDGSGSGLDADLLDGKHDGDITSCQLRISNSEKSHCLQYMQQATGWNSWDAPNQNWFHTIKLNHGNGNTYYNRTLTFDFFGHRIYTGQMQGGKFYGWKTLAFVDDNVASATKLETARTLWGRPFDGTASISGNLDYVGDINAEYYSLRRTDINSGGFYLADKFGNNRLLVYAGDSEVGIANYTTGSWSAGITLREKGEIALAWNNADKLTFNGGGEITFNQVGLQIDVKASGYYFGTAGQIAAANIHAGGLLVSPWWSYADKVPANGIWCYGNILSNQEVVATNGSDIRLKTNIRRLVGAVEMLRGLGGYFAYDYLDWAGESDRSGRIGLIYQNMGGDMLRLMGGERTVDGVTYGALNYIKSDYINLIGASVLETAARVDDHEARLQALEQQSENQQPKTNN